MPLPAALLARLKQRGIIQPPNSVENDQTEEVIAEDYDDPEPSVPAVSEKEYEVVPLGDGVIIPGCPNKYNIYHECTEFCRQTWALGKQVPSPKTERKYQRLLKRYPLPEGWQDVWEAGVGCFYFWNTSNDEVSWLPPHHPKAKVSVSASKLKTIMKEENLDRDDSNDDEESGDESGESDDSENESSEVSEQSEQEKEEEEVEEEKIMIKAPPAVKRPAKGPFQRKSFGQERRAKMQKRNDIDPMDPSAYSESCPRGKWSDGLEAKGTDKAADSTAAGPLFQMRPYPNPGEILRMNANKPESNE